MPLSRFCALNGSSHAPCDLGRALQAPAMHFLLYRMRGMDSIPGFLSAPGCQGRTANIYFMPVRGFQSWARPQRSPLSLVFAPFPKRFLSTNLPFAGSHIFNTGPIDGSGKECPLQLQGHLSPPSKRSQARSVCELCVFRACCHRAVWNP